MLCPTDLLKMIAASFLVALLLKIQLLQPQKYINNTEIIKIGQFCLTSCGHADYGSHLENGGHSLLSSGKCYSCKRYFMNKHPMVDIHANFGVCITI